MKRFLSAAAMFVLLFVAAVYVYAIFNARNAKLDDPNGCLFINGSCFKVDDSRGKG